MRLLARREIAFQKPRTRQTRKARRVIWFAALLSTLTGCLPEQRYAIVWPDVYAPMDSSRPTDSLNGKDANIAETKEDSPKDTVSVGSCKPKVLASKIVKVGKYLEIKKDQIIVYIKLVSINLEKGIVTIDITNENKEPIKEGMEIEIGKERMVLVEPVPGKMKLITIGVCEEGTDSNNANVYADF